VVRKIFGMFYEMPCQHIQLDFKVSFMSQSTSSSISGKIQVLPVQGKKMLNNFVQLAWTINQSDSMWVPPLKHEVRKFLDPQVHPFYEFGAAQAFLAYRDGVPVGRILVSDDPKLNERKGTNCGAWGMFECVDDVEVAKALFDSAMHWSREKFGRTSLIGPMNYSTNYEMGLLIRGFDTPQRFGMNHNPPYYESLVKAAGIVECQGLYAWWFPKSNEMLEKWAKRMNWFLNRSQITCRTFDAKHLDSEIRLCRDVYNISLRDNWNYAELSDGEIRQLACNLVKFSDPKHIFLAFDGEKPVGFSITIPDLNEAIKPLNGKLFPFGFLKFLYYRRRIKTCRMMVLCVDPNYRRRGISELLVIKTLQYGLEAGYDGGELSWTYRDNTAVNSIIERCGGFPYKEFGIYEYAFPCESSDPSE